MKVYIGIDRQISLALRKAFFDLISDCDSSMETPEGADLIIVENKQRLQEFYTAGQYFAVLSIDETKNLPPNARWIPLINFIPPMATFMQEIEQSLAARKTPVLYEVRLSRELGIAYAPDSLNANPLQILVVDDKPKNLQLAIDLLGKVHYLTLASGYNEALQLIKTHTYDVVLADCQMPPETKGSALSLEYIVIGQTVHNGLFLIFHATGRGAKVAIVTDANHHMDWVSALFDDADLKKPHQVNGQPVLLINYLGKEWDKALKKLMAV